LPSPESKNQQVLANTIMKNFIPSKLLALKARPEAIIKNSNGMAKRLAKIVVGENRLK